MKIKILFICGCLEHGKDGVGDYTRKLAKELVKENHKAFCISLNDSYVEKLTDDLSTVNGSDFRQTRIPAIFTWKNKVSILMQLVEGFDPDWISLQFVPYSFNNKGLPFRLACKLKNIGPTRKWHIMFHELWLCDTKSTKNKFLGRIQRGIIHNLIKNIQPAVITTTINFYRQKLKRYNADLLPLYGNISPTQIHVTQDDEVFKAVHFGTFSSNFDDLENQLNFLKRSSIAQGKSVILNIFGNTGVHGSTAIDKCNRILGDNSVRVLGRVSETEASQLFQEANIGISRANFIMAGKSGTTITMLEHGLPVLLRGKVKDLVSENWSHPSFLKQLIFHDSELESYRKFDHCNILSETSKQFTKLLVEHSKQSKTKESRL